VPAFQRIFADEPSDDGCVVVPMKEPYYFEIGFVARPGVLKNPHVQKFFVRLNACYLPFAETPYLSLVSSDLTLFRADGGVNAPVAETLTTIADRYDISPRERDVFELLAAGYTAMPIAEKLFLSVSTAKTHIYSIYKKMGIHSQNELIEICASVQES
jgi:DNA-binding CsgD family transcriptional regulator